MRSRPEPSMEISKIPWRVYPGFQNFNGGVKHRLGVDFLFRNFNLVDQTHTTTEVLAKSKVTTQDRGQTQAKDECDGKKNGKEVAFALQQSQSFKFAESSSDCSDSI